MSSHNMRREPTLEEAVYNAISSGFDDIKRVIDLRLGEIIQILKEKQT